jgi:hypothetical protein
MRPEDIKMIRLVKLAGEIILIEDKELFDELSKC